MENYLQKNKDHYCVFNTEEPSIGEYGIHSVTGKVFFIDENFYNPWVRQRVVASTDKLNGVYLLKTSDCDNIFGIFNIDSLASEYAGNDNLFDYDGFKNGFKKYAELNKEKKFTSSDMMHRAYSVAFNIGINYQKLVNKGKHEEAQKLIEEQNLYFMKELDSPVNKIRVEFGDIYEGFISIYVYDYQKEYLKNK